MAEFLIFNLETGVSMDFMDAGNRLANRVAEFSRNVDRSLLAWLKRFCRIGTTARQKDR